jgi:hypothetical protein
MLIRAFWRTVCAFAALMLSTELLAREMPVLRSDWLEAREPTGLMGLPEGPALVLGLYNRQKDPIWARVTFEIPGDAKRCEENARLEPRQEYLFRCLVDSVATDTDYTVAIAVFAEDDADKPLERTGTRFRFSAEEAAAFEEMARDAAPEADPEPSPDSFSVALADLKAVALPAKGNVSVSIEEKGPALEFESGLSPVALVLLPEYQTSYRITIRSYCQCMGFSKRIFVPSALLLDEDFQQTRTFAEASFGSLSSGFMEPYRIEGEIGVGEENRNERYLLLYTDRRTVGQEAGRVAGPSVGVASPGRISVGLGIGFKMKVKRAAGGKLKVEAEPEKPEAHNR